MSGREKFVTARRSSQSVVKRGSTKVDARCNKRTAPPPRRKKLSRRTKLTILATVDVRPTSLAVQLYRAERPAVYLQHDVRNAARRAGPSAAAETRRGSGAHEAPRVQRPVGSRRMWRCARASRPYRSRRKQALRVCLAAAADPHWRETQTGWLLVLDGAQKLQRRVPY